MNTAPIPSELVDFEGRIASVAFTGDASRFQLSMRWTQPVLPRALHKYLKPEGICDTEEEAREAREFDECNRGDRSFHVRIMDMATGHQKAVLSPYVSPVDRDCDGPFLYDKAEVEAAEKAAMEMADELCRRRAEACQPEVWP